MVISGEVSLNSTVNTHTDEREGFKHDNHACENKSGKTVHLHLQVLESTTNRDFKMGA